MMGDMEWIGLRDVVVEEAGRVGRDGGQGVDRDIVEEEGESGRERWRTGAGQE